MKKEKQYLCVIIFFFTSQKPKSFHMIFYKIEQSNESRSNLWNLNPYPHPRRAINEKNQSQHKNQCT
jgi:hypothetical protein